MKERDDKLKAAIEYFFTEDGDVHQFIYVVREAIKDLPVDAMGLTRMATKALAEHKLTKIGQVEDLLVRDPDGLLKLPGIRYTINAQVREGLRMVNSNIFKFIN